jgi:hypothetical protein
MHYSKLQFFRQGFWQANVFFIKIYLLKPSFVAKFNLSPSPKGKILEKSLFLAIDGDMLAAFYFF